MHEDLIKWFFNENGLSREGAPPVAALEHFQIKLLLENIPVEETLANTLREKLPGREEAVAAEKADIEAADTAEKLIRFMRKGTDILNQQFLVRRAVEFENDTVPEIIRMLKTSMNDLFIELSVRVLAACTLDIADELVELCDEVRGAYAQSMVLVALGFKASEQRIPWIVNKYSELKKAYPDEGFCYGAYFALYEMEARFYSDSKKFSTQPD